MSERLRNLHRNQVPDKYPPLSGLKLRVLYPLAIDLAIEQILRIKGIAVC
jgi:hypothetical protein